MGEPFLSIVPSADDESLFEVSEFGEDKELKERSLYNLEELVARVKRFMKEHGVEE